MTEWLNQTIQTYENIKCKNAQNAVNYKYMTWQKERVWEYNRMPLLEILQMFSESACHYAPEA